MVKMVSGAKYCWSVVPVRRKCGALLIPLFVLVAFTYFLGQSYFPFLRMIKLREKLNNRFVSDLYRLQPQVVILQTYLNITTTVSVTPKNGTDDSEAFRNSHIMISTGNGRLGNKMFEFASLLGIAKRHNYKPMILRRNSLLQTFDISQVTDRQPVNLKGLGERGAGVYDVSMETLSHDKNYSLGGFYQSWKYFDFMSQEVRNTFKFKSSFRDKAQQALTSLNIGRNLTIGVHVRRGDMNSKRELSRGYNVATREYFLKAFKYFRDKFKHLLFLVVSDDLNWCRSNIKDSDVRFVATGSAGSDLAFLSQCNHSVISTGSFGWWGAYLTGGEVVYYQNFPANNSWLIKQYNRTEYYPLRWIGME